jgi:hypothetical protein
MPVARHHLHGRRRALKRIRPADPLRGREEVAEAAGDGVRGAVVRDGVEFGAVPREGGCEDVFVPGGVLAEGVGECEDGYEEACGWVSVCWVERRQGEGRGDKRKGKTYRRRR